MATPVAGGDARHAADLLADVVLRIVWTPPHVQSTAAYGRHAYYRTVPLPGIKGHGRWEYEHTLAHTSQGLRGNVVFGGGSNARPSGYGNMPALCVAVLFQDRLQIQQVLDREANRLLL